MLSNNRIIWKDNNATSDVSTWLGDYLNTTALQFTLVAFDDAFYIGSDLPFNHRWIEVGTVNANASVTSVSYWDGSQWRNAVDVIDQTAVAGKPFAKSGILSWTPDRYHAWDLEQTTEDIPELNAYKIYDKYWAKITFSQNLSSNVSLKYVGHKFSSDTDLFAQHPTFANTQLMAAFQTDKTNWDEQHFTAAEMITEYLRGQGIIYSPSQVLNWQQYKEASVQKTAEIIFASFGDDYANERVAAAKAYSTAIKAIGATNIDKNANATLERSEREVSTGWLSR